VVSSSSSNFLKESKGDVDVGGDGGVHQNESPTIVPKNFIYEKTDLQQPHHVIKQLYNYLIYNK
jgi:hypothetical protein